MNLARIYLRLVAVVFLVFGVAAAFAPDQYMSLLNVGASTGGRLWGRGFGAAALGFGWVLWMLDTSVDRERRIGASGAAVTFVATALTDAVGTVGGDFTSPLGWIFVAFNTAMAVLALLVLASAPSKGVTVVDASS